MIKKKAFSINQSISVLLKNVTCQLNSNDQVLVEKYKVLSSISFIASKFIIESSLKATSN